MPAIGFAATANQSPRGSGGSESTGVVDNKTYKVHAFNSSGDLIIDKGVMDIDALIIAGGGSGGFADDGSQDTGGGGGAGGYREIQSISISPGNYPATVGSGGVGGSSASNKGSDSSVLGYIAAGGGGGASRRGSGNATSGGSGGGGSYNHISGASGNVPSTDPVQGYGGGSVPGNYRGGSGGGGGGGGPGQNNSTTVGGAGGVGVTTNFSGQEITYAVGGKGGTAASSPPIPEAGDPNTGSGGAGGNSPATNNWNIQYGASGGSGVVMIRYVL